ncbi:hypothetical protein E2C01_039171 [Portunus trituberculatus]|uniref:Uncharacterized protein n=1 Tax=Portunus trituberculatus TaxID=210409 RepID=A0A5B7FG56_PORTR|nr:hypothetical protein [Portunus trituberculatus]
MHHGTGEVNTACYASSECSALQPENSVSSSPVFRRPHYQHSSRGPPIDHCGICFHKIEEYEEIEGSLVQGKPLQAE